MTRSSFGRTQLHHIAAYRTISVAVRDWARNIRVSPVPYPTVLTVGLPAATRPADLIWYSQILERALNRTAVKIETHPLVRANISQATATRSHRPLAA